MTKQFMLLRSRLRLEANSYCFGKDSVCFTDGNNHSMGVIRRGPGDCCSGSFAEIRFTDN